MAEKYKPKKTLYIPKVIGRWAMKKSKKERKSLSSFVTSVLEKEKNKD